MFLQTQLKTVRSPRDLPDAVAVVMGLLEMGFVDVAELASLGHVRDQRTTRRILRALSRSKNPRIREWMKRGLPPGSSRPLPAGGPGVRCPVCGALVNYVPCPRCSLMTQRGAPEKLKAVEAAGEKPPLDDRPTLARPGTRKKVRVMRDRVNRGLAACHPEDAR